MKKMSEIKERPILFSGEMVRAILQSRKTQTRRIIKPQPIEGAVLEIHSNNHAFFEKSNYPEIRTIDYFSIKCPYEKGQLLWIRERFTSYKMKTFEEQETTRKIIEKFQKGEVRNIVEEALKIPAGTGGEKFLYAADFGEWADDPDSDFDWKSPIHMPRCAARIILQIEDVRVERVQDISEEDARAEGVEDKSKFILLWDSILNNVKRGYGWETNPFVWVIKFKKL